MTTLYPLNLLLVSLAAGITFYLGFLPVKDIPRSFFIQQAFVTIVLWALAGFTSGLHVGGYIIGCGLIATTAWRQFCLQREFLAKVWLSGAAAFGGTLCLLMLIPALVLPPGASVWLVTSVYFGAFLLAAAHMAAMVPLAASRNEPLPAVFTERVLSFFFLALALRGVLLVAMVAGFPKLFGEWGSHAVYVTTDVKRVEFIARLVLGLFAPAALALAAWKQIKKNAEPRTLLWILAAAEVSVFAGEYLARRLYF